MNIVIMGSGGLGGYFGARFAAAGNDVTFIARGAHLAAMQHEGLRVESAVAPLHLHPVRAVENVEGIGIADIVIVAVKLWGTEAAARTIQPVIGPHTAVVSFQNGVDAADRIAAVVGDEHVLGGVSYIGATLEAPGVVRHTGTIARLIFGERDGTLSPRVEAFASACERAGIDRDASTDITRAIWEKFVFLVGLSAVTCLYRDTIGPIRANPRGRALLLAIMHEVVAVGLAMGVALDPEFAEKRVSFIDTLPATMTASMFTDLQRGNRLEVPWLSGKVAALGAQLGIATPANQFVSDALALAVDGVRQ